VKYIGEEFWLIVRIAVPDPYVVFDPNHAVYVMGAVPDTAGKEQALAE
jgi:hypothetical protein